MSHRSDSSNEACFLGLVGHMTWCFAPIQQRDVEDMDDLTGRLLSVVRGGNRPIAAARRPQQSRE